MAKKLVLISIFVDGTNKLKKATKVKNVKEIQDQAKKMYPSIGEATLDRFMVYSNDFEEFLDVDKSHQVEAKEKYELHFKSPETSPTPRAAAPSTPSKKAELPQTPISDISPAMVGRLRACPSLYNMQSCLTNQEVRNASQIYRKNLTKYRKGINECAHQLALKDPGVLQNKGTLLKMAQEALCRSGYVYSRNSVAKQKFLGSPNKAKCTTVPRDSTTVEHSYCTQLIDLGESSQSSDPPDVEQANDQSGSQTPENVPSEQGDGSSDVVANLEKLVETVIQEERCILNSTMPAAQEDPKQQDGTPERSNEESVEEKELRKASMIYGRNGKINLTSYHTQMNEMAYRIALEKPHLLDKRGELYTEAQKLLYYSGYKYSRCNQTRSRLFQPGVYKREQHQTKKVRENRFAEIDIKISTLKEQIALITSEKTKLVGSEWNKRADQLDKQISEVQGKIVSLESEKRQIKQKEEWLKKKSAWAAKRKGKKNKKLPWRPRKEPTIETTEPSMETTEPSMEATEHPMETTESSMEATEPSMETTESTMDTMEPTSVTEECYATQLLEDMTN